MVKPYRAPYSSGAPQCSGGESTNSLTWFPEELISYPRLLSSPVTTIPYALSLCHILSLSPPCVFLSPLSPCSKLLCSFKGPVSLLPDFSNHSTYWTAKQVLWKLLAHTGTHTIVNPVRRARTTFLSPLHPQCPRGAWQMVGGLCAYVSMHQ